MSYFLRLSLVLIFLSILPACSDKQPQTVSRTVAPSEFALSSANDKIFAHIETTMGEIVVELFWSKAPVTVQNFVGLAEGTKSFIDVKTGEETKRPFYDGLTFHRVMPRFMIQGGDPKGTGTGGPGYKFDDEFVDGLGFEKPGVLAMANGGPNSNGSQFFITTGTPTHLKGKHTVFGKVVTGQDIAVKIGGVKTKFGNKPKTPIVIEKLTIERRPASN